MNADKTKKLTDRLNETGFPFQEWCFKCVKDSCGILSRQEFPYTFPPSSQSIKGDVNSIDILSLKIPYDQWRDHCWVYYFIECKKSKLGVKNWCFIKTNRSPKPTPSRFFAGHFYKNEDQVSLGFQSQFIDHDRLFGPEADVVIHGYEVNNTLDRLNRNQEEKIYKSAMQAVLACSWLESLKTPLIPGFANENYIAVWAKGVIPIDYPAVVSMPVLVTTSEIFVASIVAEDVDGATGEISAENVRWEKRELVIYDLGLPDWLQDENLPSYTRGVVVINQSAFKKFLDINYDKYTLS